MIRFPKTDVIIFFHPAFQNNIEAEIIKKKFRI